MANVIKLKNSGTANSTPTSLEVGELAINYADGILYYKNSSNAISILSSALYAQGASSIEIATTPPASPSSGDLWFESDTGKQFIYYDSFWIEISGADGSQGATGSTGPEGGATTLTTKGDILARGTSEPVRLPVGTDGKVLTANSSTTTGLEWVSPTVYATVANLSTLSNTVTDISGNASTLSNTVTTLSANVSTLSNTVTTLSANVSTLSNTVTLKANIASPALTGVPTAPTAANTVNNTQIATTAYVKTVIGDLINSAPETLDTLGEIASSLANNNTLSSTLTTSIALKAPLADPTFTGTVTIPAGASISGFATLADPTFTGNVAGITKTMVGLGSVDDTTDLGKPISNATQTALDLKAPLANATFTGTIVLPATTSIANVTSTEIGYLDGVTSAIQTQLDNKQAIIANVSDTEIGYLDGVTSAIQTQLNTKASTGKAIAMAIVFGG